MSDAGKRLRDLIEHAVNASDPEASLRALVALRQDLEDFERLQVARALQRGASFGNVARAMGISRQSAHRRYRELLHQLPVDDSAVAAGTRTRILVTIEARQAVRMARAEAAELGSPVVGTEHLLLGILRARDPRVAASLRRHGVDLDEARARVQPTLVDEDAPVPRTAVPEGPAGISDHTRAVLEDSLREAVRRGDGYIGPEHLLLAALRSPQAGARRTLTALGVDPDVVAAAAAQ